MVWQENTALCLHRRKQSFVVTGQEGTAQEDEEAAGCIKPHIWVAPTSSGPQLHLDETSSAERPGQAGKQGRKGAPLQVHCSLSRLNQSVLEFHAKTQFLS